MTFVQGLFADDFVVLLISVEDDDSMADIANKVAYHAVDRRVRRQERPMQVSVNGKLVSEALTAAQAGVKHWDVVEVAYT
jgi:toluene monooxygenase system protein B